jgi:hypothetical protein
MQLLQEIQLLRHNAYVVLSVLHHLVITSIGELGPAYTTSTDKFKYVPLNFFSFCARVTSVFSALTSAIAAVTVAASVVISSSVSMVISIIVTAASAPTVRAAAASVIIVLIIITADIVSPTMPATAAHNSNSLLSVAVAFSSVTYRSDAGERNR